MYCCCWAAVLLERLFPPSLRQVWEMGFRRRLGGILLLLLGMGLMATSQARAPSVRVSQEVCRGRGMSSC